MKKDNLTYELYKKIFLQINEGVLILDTSQSNLPIVYANKAIKDIIGVVPQYFFDKDISAFDLSNAKPINKDKLFDSIKNMKKTTVDIIIKKNNDKNIYTRITVNPIRNNSEVISHLALIIRDITVQRLYLLNCVKMEVVKTTLETVNDIVLNYMQHLELFRIECEEKTNVSKEKLKVFDETFYETLSKLQKLNSLMEFKENKIGGQISILNGV